MIILISATEVDVNEGEFKTVQATDDMLYPNINSCLTVTYAYNTGVRSGGHAVLFPTPDQLTLELMVEKLSDMNKAKIFYLLGCIRLWNENYFDPVGGRNITINGKVVHLQTVESIVPALGYDASSNAFLYDTCVRIDNPVDILFKVSPNLLLITDRKTGDIKYNKPWPAYNPSFLFNPNSFL